MGQDTSLHRGFKRQLTATVARFLRRPRLSAAELRLLEPAHILVVRQHNQMGDMVCATPVFRALAEAYPTAQIGLVTAPVNREVVENNPHLQRIFTFDQRMWRQPGRLWSFLRSIREFRPELTFVLSSVSFSVTSAAIGLASGARWVVGADSLPFGFDLSRHAFSLELPSQPELDCHAVEHSLAPLRAVGLGTDNLQTVVVPGPGNVAEAEAIMTELELTPGFWAIHPGAGKKQNIWPGDRFADLARRAVGAGRQVLVLHGPADAEALQQMVSGLTADIKVAPRCSVGTGAALLDRADRFLCNDTGVMHVAGALGVPTVALFGPTRPELWKPPSEAVVVVKSPRQSADDRGREFGWMENIDPDLVWSAWQGLSSRSPATISDGK